MSDLSLVSSNPHKDHQGFIQQDSTLNAQYWLVPGSDSSMFSQSN